MSNFYSLKAERPGGKVYDFADLKGKTVLIVNVASQWWVFVMQKFIRADFWLPSGFTSQYKG